MTERALTKTGFAAGTWRGLLTGSPETPQLLVTHLDNEISGVSITATKDAGTWQIEVAIPPEVLGDGVQTLVISDLSTGLTLQTISLIAGDALDEDLRAEIDLLRAELELLKRAFRRHCNEGP
ncbi:MAG: hypothetical protein AAF999_00760 [Pseudomonadota bacterium]